MGPLTLNYGNIQQQQHLGQDPQHRNHHPDGNRHHIRHGELHVTNGKVKTENGNLFYPPLCRFATMSSRRNGNCSPRLDTEAHSVLPLRSSSPLSQVRSQLQPTTWPHRQYNYERKGENGKRKTNPLTAQANCPPETGWTRSIATEGVDITLTSNL